MIWSKWQRSGQIRWEGRRRRRPTFRGPPAYLRTPAYKTVKLMDLSHFSNNNNQFLWYEMCEFPSSCSDSPRISSPYHTTSELWREIPMRTNSRWPQHLLLSLPTTWITPLQQRQFSYSNSNFPLSSSFDVTRTVEHPVDEPLYYPIRNTMHHPDGHQNLHNNLNNNIISSTNNILLNHRPRI